MRQLINTFNAGFFSPLLKGRVNIDKYKGACQSLQNFIPTVYGGAKNRTGTGYIGEVRDSSKVARIIEFQFNTDQTYAIVLNDGYMRFVKNNAILGAPYEITHPYADADLFDLQYSQINDVVYIVGSGYPVYKLARTADTSWTLTEVDFGTLAPQLDSNVTTTTLSSSGTSGSVTITASSSVFNVNHVGSTWTMTHTQAGSTTKLALTSTAATAGVFTKGNVFVNTVDLWTGTLNIEVSPDNATWTVLRGFQSSEDRNLDLTIDFSGEGQYVRLNFTYTSHTGTAPAAYLEVQKYDLQSSFKITGYSSGTSVTATILDTLLSTATTTEWSEGAFSDHQGYPSTVTIHEQRLVLAGTTRSPAQIWFSAVNGYEDFKRGTLDSDSFTYIIAANQRNGVEWISSSQDLLVGTTGGEFRVSSVDFSSPITPTNVSIKRQSNYGCLNIQALMANFATIYVQRNGLKVREMIYDDSSYSYVSSDISVFAESLISSGVKEMSFRLQNDAVLWFVNNDGDLIGLTYEKEQNVTGWHKHTTDGTFESVGCLYGNGTTDDQTLFIVNRTIGGQTKRFIEYLTPEEEAQEDQWYLDSAIKYDSTATTTITGLSHLEGETVNILADGATHPSKVVASGEIELNRSASVVIVGLPYQSVLSPMPLNVDDNQGTSLGANKRVSKIVVKYINSGGHEYGRDLDNLTPVSRRDSSMTMNDPVPLFSGETALNFDSPVNTEANIYIVQNQPLPLHILSITAKYETYDI